MRPSKCWHSAELLGAWHFVLGCAARCKTVSGTDSFRFPGQRGPAAEVVSISTALQIIVLLPRKAAAAVRLKASVLLVRFLGGDLSLIAQIYDMNQLQRHLQEHWPEHPLARFGEAAAATSSAWPRHLAKVWAGAPRTPLGPRVGAAAAGAVEAWPLAPVAGPPAPARPAQRFRG